MRRSEKSAFEKARVKKKQDNYKPIAKWPKKPPRSLPPMYAPPPPPDNKSKSIDSVEPLPFAKQSKQSKQSKSKNLKPPLHPPKILDKCKYDASKRPRHKPPPPPLDMDLINLSHR